MFTQSRAVYRATNTNGPYIPPKATSADDRLGVVGLDFNTKSIRQILLNVKKMLFRYNTGRRKISNENLIISFFFHPKDTPKGTLSLISSSDLDLFNVINNVDDDKKLQMPFFLGSYIDSKTNSETTKYASVSRTVMQATIKSSTRAIYLSEQIAKNPNYNHYYEDLELIQEIPDGVNVTTTTTDGSDEEVPSWKHNDVNDPLNEWLVSAVAMDNIFNGIVVTIACKKDFFFNFEKKSIIGTISATVAVIFFIASVLYLGETFFEKFGMTTTALSLGAMFACFIFVITLWISAADDQMTEIVQLLSDQLQTEVVEGLKTFLSVPILINRWNHVLLHTKALELSMHNSSWNNRTEMSRLQLQIDSTFSDEMRRRPSIGGTRPYLVYGGSSDGGFNGCLSSSATSNGALGLGITSIDSSTVTSKGKLRLQYDLMKIKNLNTNVDLYRRDINKGATDIRYNYVPSNRGWYKRQKLTPDIPSWSSIYVFNSNQKLGITGTRGYGLQGTELGQVGSIETVLAVDYTLDIVSDLLKSIIDEVKQDIAMESSAYVVENDGNLIGVSSSTPVVIRYPDSNSVDQLGLPQRLNAELSADNVVKITYTELKARTIATIESEASGLANFNENGTNAFVAEGSEIGRILIRSTRITDDYGLNWTTVIAVSEESFLHGYRVKEIQAIVVGLGMCCITVYILSLLLSLSATIQKNAINEDNTKIKGIKGTNPVDKPPKVRKLSTYNQARMSFNSMINDDDSFFGGMMNNDTFDIGEDTSNIKLSDLSPDSEEFFNIYYDILKAPVESANLAMRLHNDHEPRPPSVFGVLQSILKIHNKSLKKIFECIDDDSSGTISFIEFCNGLRKFTKDKSINFDPTQAELALLFDALDKNGDGSVSFEELLHDESKLLISESSATAGEKHRALRYITLVFNCGLSLPYILQLERSLDFARLRGYQIFSSFWYQFMYGFFIFTSLSLAFFEAPASWGSGSRTRYLTKENSQMTKDIVLPVNGICLFIYVCDFIFEIWLRGFREGGQDKALRGGDKGANTREQIAPPIVQEPPLKKTESSKTESSKTESSKTESSKIESSTVDTWNGSTNDENISLLIDQKRKCFDLFDYKYGGKLRTMTITRFILLMIMLFDFFYRVGMPYFSGPSTTSNANGDNDEYLLILFLPYSSLIRPLWLISRYKDVRRALGNFISTLIKAMDVFILFVLLMTVGSIMGVLLLSGRMDDSNINNYNKFDNFLSGLLTLFVYMASAENYPDVVYPGTSCDKNNIANSLVGGVKSAGCPETAFHIFTILFSFAGAFIIVSLIIGVFENEFAENTQRQEKKDRRNKSLGIIAAFILLDKDRGGTLDSNEFLSFINGTCETDRQFEVPDNFQLSGQEFLELIDEMSHEFNSSSSVELPENVLVTPYRRCIIKTMDIPKNWVVGKRILLNEKEEETGKTVTYHYSIPTNVKPGQKNVTVCGLSEEKIIPSKNETFASINSNELCHWFCYNQGIGRFPYNCNEEKNGENNLTESDIITYYRYQAADMCVTRNRLENKSTIIPEDEIGKNNYKSKTSFSLAGKEIDPAEATRRWKNAIRKEFIDSLMYPFIYSSSFTLLTTFLPLSLPFPYLFR